MAQAIGSPANPSAGATPWILGPSKDLALVIATPLLILPGVALARRGMSVESIAYYVAAFGALGHHLPGMMRAYGDRDLFARFRSRFLVAPIVLVAVCVFFQAQDLNGIRVIATVWGVWHGLAQAYGFGRIYDTKTGSPSPLTARIDFALCIAWFGAGVLFSPGRLGNLLQQFYESGGPLIEPATIHSLQAAWGLATVVVTLVFAVNYVVEARRGRTQSAAKLLLFASSFGFWWYAMIGLENVLLGVALFEIFHDFQYLAIVWSFNRKVVDRGGRVGGFTRFLFRNSGAMVGLYVDSCSPTAPPPLRPTESPTRPSAARCSARSWRRASSTSTTTASSGRCANDRFSRTWAWAAVAAKPGPARTGSPAGCDTPPPGACSPCRWCTSPPSSSGHQRSTGSRRTPPWSQPCPTTTGRRSCSAACCSRRASPARRVRTSNAPRSSLPTAPSRGRSSATATGCSKTGPQRFAPMRPRSP